MASTPNNTSDDIPQSTHDQFQLDGVKRPPGLKANDSLFERPNRTTHLKPQKQSRAARAGEAYGTRMRERRARNARTHGRKVETEEEQPKKMGFGFWMIFAISLCKDLIVDPLATVSVYLSFFLTPAGMTMSFIIAFYLFYIGVQPSTRKVLLWAVSSVLESLPFLGLIPAASFSLLVLREIENGDGFISKMLGFTTKLKEWKRKRAHA